MVPAVEASTISLSHIQEAATVVDPVFLNSPQLSYENLNQHLGAEIVLKIETINPIRSFKGRGADYCIHKLPDEAPLVTASAGNFGQGLAYAARKRSRQLVVFAAVNANELKLDRMKQLGAEVILSGHDFDAAKAAAREYAARTGRRFIEDGREAPIAEGAGTIAVELLDRREKLDAIVVPVGNGALINGIGTWMKARSPETSVIGVCAANAPAMELSWRAGQTITTESASTIADGIAARVPVPEALESMRRTVDEIVLVDDRAMVGAMRLILRETGVMVEPSGAAGIAAILTNRERFSGRSIATILCGGNVTAAQFRQWFIE